MSSTNNSSFSSVLWNLFIAFCLATLITESALFSLAWGRGWIQSARIQRATEAFYGVERRAIRTHLASESVTDGDAMVNKALRERAMRVSDLPVRANVSRRDSIEIAVERNSLRIDQMRYEQTRIGFDRALDADIEKMESAAIDASQSLLDQLTPNAAKEHLMLILTAPGDNDLKQAMNDVVAILRRVAPDRRRKIFAEFQTPEESAQVEAMLRRIREVESQPSRPSGAAGASPP
jgi:hypothetical protein